MRSSGQPSRFAERALSTPPRRVIDGDGVGPSSTARGNYAGWIAKRFPASSPDEQPSRSNNQGDSRRPDWLSRRVPSPTPAVSHRATVKTGRPWRKPRRYNSTPAPPTAAIDALVQNITYAERVGHADEHPDTDVFALNRTMAAHAAVHDVFKRR